MTLHRLFTAALLLVIIGMSAAARNWLGVSLCVGWLHSIYLTHRAEAQHQNQPPTP